MEPGLRRCPSCFAGARAMASPRDMAERTVLLAAEAPPAARPWWRQPAPWLWLVTIVVVGGALAIWRGPRRLFDLVVENGVEAGCSYEGYQLPVRLGAADGNDITFVEVCVSRNHTVLERRGSVIEIVGLNSENGTFVNGERVSRQQLVDGDEISLGGGLDLSFEGRG